MLKIMNLRKRFLSLIPISSLTLLALALLSGGSTSCGTDQACLYFTKVEYDIGHTCPSRNEAQTFFQGDFCSSTITSVDADGVFDGTTCCYAVTQSNDGFTDCGIGPVPPPEPGVTTSTSGGTGGVGGTGGIGGAGGSGGTCVGCAEFLTTTNPPMLCTTSIPIYEAYSGCMCNGACAMVCADTCKMQTSSMACEMCLIDSTNGCGNQHDACLADP
jgi:hypothetical protein